MLIRTISDGYINSRWIDQITITRDPDGKFLLVIKLHGRSDRQAIGKYATEQEAHAAIRKIGMKVKSLKVVFDEAAS